MYKPFRNVSQVLDMENIVLSFLVLSYPLLLHIYRVFLYSFVQSILIFLV
jgi:hypothetical protein